MALTELDKNTALIVVDMQKGVIQPPVAKPIATVIERCAELARGFRHYHLPVVLVRVAGVAPGRTEVSRQASQSLPEGFTDFIEQLAQQPTDIIVTKYSWGAFATTDLVSRLEAIGVTQVVIAGVATGTGVDATARQAYEAGFNVALAVDAMADSRPEAHSWSIEQVFPRLGETATTRDILDELARQQY